MSEAIVVPGRRLGKANPKYDRRTLHLATYIEKRKLPKVPESHVLSEKTLEAFPDLGEMKNRELGCCTIAAIGHAFQAWTVYGDRPWRPTDEGIVAAYDKINGGVDQGAAMLDALKLARKEGIDGHRISAFVSVNPQDHDQVRTAHYLFGGLYFGANLPVATQEQLDKAQTWHVGEGSAFAPGSWGGHALNLYDTGKDVLVVPTWGKLQKLTWAWWDRYVDEAYAVLEDLYVGDDDVRPEGFSLAKLAEDISAL
jgi:hypothetical protein